MLTFNEKFHEIINFTKQKVQILIIIGVLSVKSLTFSEFLLIRHSKVIFYIWIIVCFINCKPFFMHIKQL